MLCVFLFFVKCQKAAITCYGRGTDSQHIDKGELLYSTLHLMMHSTVHTQQDP